MPVEVIYRRYVFATTHDNEMPCSYSQTLRKGFKSTASILAHGLSTNQRFPFTASHSVQNLDLKSAFSSSNDSYEPLTEFCYCARDCWTHDKHIVTTGIRRTVVGTKPDLKTRI